MSVTPLNSRRVFVMLGLLLALAFFGTACAAEPLISAPGVQIHLGSGSTSNGEISSGIKVLLGMTVLALAPAILMSMTSFIRIVVVLSMLRHALGMQDTPPNTVIVSLSLFLTLFTMAPTLQEVNSQAFQPYSQGKLNAEKAAQVGLKPIREFMVRQTREQDLALMVDLAKAERPNTIDDISLFQLIPSFMLSELRSAFQIGFVIFLPFLLIDLIVSSTLMSLGMMMVPPTTISLPLKIVMFVLIDGWSLVVRALVGTFS